MKVRNTRTETILEVYAQGATLNTLSGYKTYFDTKKDKYICIYNNKQHEFKDLVSMLSFIVFSDADIEINLVLTRYQWYVISHEKAYAVFSRMSDAVSFCSRITSDVRNNKSISKIGKSVYLYIGPRTTQNKQFYIGLREELIAMGFNMLIKEFEDKMQKQENTFYA
jgi:hypothetical protein